MLLQKNLDMKRARLSVGTLGEFRESMRDVYSTSVRTSTLDEAPMAYRPINEILKNIQDTIEVIDVIKPIYNYKAG